MIFSAKVKLTILIKMIFVSDFLVTKGALISMKNTVIK
jgi:hypothetical protein